MKLPEELKIAKSLSAPIIQIDDDEILLRIVDRYYHKTELKNPYLSFKSGKDFLDYLKAVKEEKKEFPLLVLLDINMPGMDGFEVLSHIRADEFFKELPLCSMLSSSSHPDDMEKSKNLGADGYIVKPDNAKEYIEFFEDIYNQVE